jgi:hypothetical protein
LRVVGDRGDRLDVLLGLETDAIETGRHLVRLDLLGVLDVGQLEHDAGLGAALLELGRPPCCAGEPCLIFQPLFAVVLMTCSSCDVTLFRYSCGESRFSTRPMVLPRRKRGKYGITVKCLYGLQSSCSTHGPAVTRQRIFFMGGR